MPKTSSKAILLRSIKAAIGLLVIGMVAREVYRTVGGLRASGTLPRIEAPWLVAAGAIYVLGLTVLGFWYWRVLRAGPATTGLYAAERAYLVSHLGKYVPGKALVVVIRASLTTRYGARPTTSAFAAFYETLVMMATGGLVAAIGFALPGAPTIPLKIPGFGSPPVAWVAGLLGLALFGLALPEVFPRLARLASRPLRMVRPEEMPRFSWRLLLEGIGLSAVGWVLLGFSQLAVLRAFGISGLSFEEGAIAVASVALATVAGFVIAVAPGGLGVREWVLWTSLGAVLPHDRAVLASLMLRLAWLAAEVFIAGLLFVIRPKPVSAIEPAAVGLRPVAPAVAGGVARP